MLLFKDYSTDKKSITVTGMIITFFLTVASVIVNFIVLLDNGQPYPAMTFSCLAFFSIFAALYWNKRFRASTSGIELLTSSEAAKEEKKAT